MNDPRYPIGPFRAEQEYGADERDRLIRALEEAPQRLRDALDGLPVEALDTPYREGGWTVQQVVHHVPDSHLNAYIRCKWALTEDVPVIKAYFEERWAELPDTRDAPLEVSLALLDALHARWTLLFRALTPDDYARIFMHPEHGPQTLEQTLASYAWHGAHHTAHILSLRRRRSW